MADRDEADVRLMLRVKAGDREAFAALYVRFSRPLFRFLLRMTGRREAAEDCLQETFLRVWRAAPAWAPGAAPATWLFTIAKNVWLNALARERGRPVTFADLDAAAGVPPSDAPPPGARLEAAERTEAVRRAVDRLPPGERAVAALAVHGRLRYADIARVLEIPEGTVKSRMAGAVKRLRQKLGTNDQ